MRVVARSAALASFDADAWPVSAHDARDGDREMQRVRNGRTDLAGADHHGVARFRGISLG